MTTFSIPTRREMIRPNYFKFRSVDPVTATKLIKYRMGNLVEYKAVTTDNQTVPVHCEIGRTYWRKLHDDQKDDQTNKGE